jgi:hypothetical protein
MCKISHFSDNSQENSGKITFSSVKNIKVEATTDAMSLSSHGGLLLLQREEEHLALASQLTSCVHDSRTPYLIKHSLTEIIMTQTKTKPYRIINQKILQRFVIFIRCQVLTMTS